MKIVKKSRKMVYLILVWNTFDENQRIFGFLLLNFDFTDPPLQKPNRPLLLLLLNIAFRSSLLLRFFRGRNSVDRKKLE